jgi:hypothetical protein
VYETSKGATAALGPAPVLSQHQVLHNLEVGFLGFIINAYAGA